MDHIYADAHEKYVKNTLVYTDGTYVYLDEECTVKATKEQLENIYLKGGILVNVGGRKMHMTECFHASTHVLVVAGDSEYYSAEYEHSNMED